LGELYSNVAESQILVPNGFAITADAYRYFLSASNKWGDLHDVLDSLNPSDMADLSRRGQLARNIVLSTPFPPDLERQICDNFQNLQKQYSSLITVAVRSSATAEDLPTASFAGQHDSFLNISTEAECLYACRMCYASLFNDRAIHYRYDNHFDHFKVALSIGIQKMVRSDIASSGVMFTLDTDSGHPDITFITSNFGLGETIVQVK
jgi:pyruvate,water dikinase